jgi:urea ABC transporter ATP-binding protein UrtE
MLELENVHAYYGESHVLRGVSLSVAKGEVVCLLGRNGAGKTTLMRSLMGILPNRAGKILFDGQDVTNLPSHERARRGMAYVPQGRLVFPQLTVAENLRSGTLIGGATDKKRSGFGPIDESVFGYFPILRERLGQRAGTLSGGEQQMLALGRALAAHPRLLLLDEPSEGIQPSIVQQIRDIIMRIAQDRNLAVLLVEQNLKFATGASSRGYVMDKGRIVAEGSVAELAKDSVVSQHLTFVEEKRQPA